jgi:hypothetical protein
MIGFSEVLYIEDDSKFGAMCTFLSICRLTLQENIKVKTFYLLIFI